MSNFRIQLDHFLRPETIFLGLRASTKQQLLEEIVDVLANNKLIDNKRIVLQKLLKREALGSTALAEGIALPHALIPGLSQPIVALGVHEQGLNFNSPEGWLTEVFLIILGNEDNPGQQLKILAHICRLIKETDFVDQIKRASSPSEVLRRVKVLEGEVG